MAKINYTGHSLLHERWGSVTFEFLPNNKYEIVIKTNTKSFGG